MVKEILTEQGDLFENNVVDIGRIADLADALDTNGKKKRKKTKGSGLTAEERKANTLRGQQVVTPRMNPDNAWYTKS